MRSFWEKNSLLEYDIAIVGAGIVGLSVASAILERHPKLRVLVLERSMLPTGASTRNAGFAHFGSLTELIADEAKMGLDNCLALVEKRWKGLLGLVKRLGKKAIDFQAHGGYELLLKQHPQDLKDKIFTYNDLLKSIFPTPVFSDSSHRLGEFGFQGGTGMLFNRYDAQIDTGKMMNALWLYTQKKGARILTGADVQHFQAGEQGIEITLQDDFTIKTAKIVVCTNAFSGRFFPELEITPGRGQVLITKPLPTPLRFKGTFHFDEGYYYFRNYQNRVLFGGGRNIDFAGETTTEFALTAPIQADLKQKLADIILPNQPFEIDMAWAGIMAFSADKSPLMKEVAPNTWLVARLNGMGVALASQLAEELADQITHQIPK